MRSSKRQRLDQSSQGKKFAMLAGGLTALVLVALGIWLLRGGEQKKETSQVAWSGQSGGGGVADNGQTPPQNGATSGRQFTVDYSSPTRSPRASGASATKGSPPANAGVGNGGAPASDPAPGATTKTKPNKPKIAHRNGRQRGAQQGVSGGQGFSGGGSGRGGGGSYSSGSSMGGGGSSGGGSGQGDDEGADDDDDDEGEDDDGEDDDQGKSGGQKPARVAPIGRDLVRR